MHQDFAETLGIVRKLWYLFLFWDAGRLKLWLQGDEDLVEVMEELRLEVEGDRFLIAGRIGFL